MPLNIGWVEVDLDSNAVDSNVSVEAEGPLVCRDKKWEEFGKSQWITDARLAFKPSRRRNCYVCGNFGHIAHAHHTVPLADQFEHGFKRPDGEHVWLCPNHHAILHVLIDPAKDAQSLGARAVRVLDYLSVEEARIMFDLIGLSGRRPEE